MNTSLYFPSDLCLHILSPHLGLVFSLFSLDCQRAEVNHFDESQFISIFFWVSCFWCQSWDSFPNPWVNLPFYELYSLILFLDLWLTLSYFSVCDARYGLKFISLYNNTQCFHIICWKKHPFFTELLLQFGQNSFVYVWLFCELFCSIVIFFCLATSNTLYLLL